MLNGEELSSAYASADIFMMPSESETLGFVALEAMASGLAVVSVAAGGLVDIITRPGVIGGSHDSAVWLWGAELCGRWGKQMHWSNNHKAEPALSRVQFALHEDIAMATTCLRSAFILSSCLRFSAHTIWRT